MSICRKYHGVLFFIYLILLTFFILFKGSPAYFLDCMKTFCSKTVLQELYNLYPFANIGSYLYQWQNPWLMMNLLVNIVLFLPFGFFLKKYKFPIAVTALAGMALSLFYEVVQRITGFGAFDVDDIILNTAGTLAGYGGFVLFQKKEGIPLPEWLRYILVQGIVNLVYLLCYTSFYYLFGLEMVISKVLGLFIGTAMGEVLWYGQGCFWKNEQWVVLALPFLLTGKELQLWGMENVISRWIPYGWTGLWIVLILWGMVLLIWYPLDRKIEQFCGEMIKNK